MYKNHILLMYNVVHTIKQYQIFVLILTRLSRYRCHHNKYLVNKIHLFFQYEKYVRMTLGTSSFSFYISHTYECSQNKYCIHQKIYLLYDYCAVLLWKVFSTQLQHCGHKCFLGIWQRTSFAYSYCFLNRITYLLYLIRLS